MIRPVFMRAVKLKIPPVVVVFVLAVLMWFSALATPAVGIDFPARDLFALCVAVAGAVTSALGVESFRRAGTTVNPLTPGASSSLVRSGIYRVSRNPMYLGFLMLLLGWGIYVWNVLAFLLVPAFLIYMNRFQIEPEERALTSRFGQEFIAYTIKVRRWL